MLFYAKNISFEFSFNRHSRRVFDQKVEKAILQNRDKWHVRSKSHECNFFRGMKWAKKPRSIEIR